MQSGVSLYLAIIVMVIFLAIVLGLTAILIGQMKMVREMGYSVIALSAADAGIEEILTTMSLPTSTCLEATHCPLDGAEYYLVIRDSSDPDCTSTVKAINYCIISVGIYKGIKRAIEIVY